jgi:hypothetical protein
VRHRAPTAALDSVPVPCPRDPTDPVAQVRVVIKLE